MPDIVGLHHLSLPARDCMLSSDWYERVLGFSRVMIEEEEDAVITVALQHQCDVLLYLRLDRRGIETTDGTAHLRPALSFRVPSTRDLDAWDERLTALGIEHSAPRQVHLGWAVDVAGPDGLLIQLHTHERLSADPD